LQGRGLGTALLRTLIEFAQNRGMRHIKASPLVENTALRQVFEQAGFDLQVSDHDLLAILDLDLHR